MYLQVGSDFSAHIILSTSQIVQPNQVAVTNLTQ
jgi:hypothetical protein